LQSWIKALLSVICRHHIGLYLDEQGVRLVDVRPGWLAVARRSWSRVRAVELRRRHAKDEKKVARIATFLSPLKNDDLVLDEWPGQPPLLEDPAWIVMLGERWLAWKEGRGLDKGAEANAELDQLGSDLEAATCQNCGASVIVHIGEPQPVCRGCGAVDSVAAPIRDAVARLARLIQALPAARRQLAKRWTERLVAERRSTMRDVIYAGGWSAGIWLLLALGGSIVGIVHRDWKGGLGFAAVGLGFGLLSLGLAWATTLIMEWLARKIAEPCAALPPIVPDGKSRCRMCGADMTSGGPIYRCQYCGTDNLLTGGALQRKERSALDVVRQVLQTGARSQNVATATVERAAHTLSIFTGSQIFWLGIPVIVMLSGSYMLLWIPLICLAAIGGVIWSAVNAIRRTVFDSSTRPDSK
jgi:hypothetical protein